jgi:hypothetical protein
MWVGVVLAILALVGLIKLGAWLYDVEMDIIYGFIDYAADRADERAEFYGGDRTDIDIDARSVHFHGGSYDSEDRYLDDDDYDEF